LDARRLAAVVVLVVAAAGAVAGAEFLLIGRGTTTSATTGLPAGCVRPQGGYLIVAGRDGFNDSVDHGVPANWWPVINATQGQTVNITVCNTDFQAHGFQVTHYFDSRTTTIVPGQVLHVSFVAQQTGEFRIYCDIFCSIHWAMQSGLLRVSPA
jgi:hypothetical protein